MERLWRNFTREEEFLRAFETAAGAAAGALGGEWRLDYDNDNRKRRQAEDLISSGELEHLVFESAAVYQDESGGTSSVQITLRSATRVVTVRVSDLRSDKPTAEKIIDTLTEGIP